MFGRKHMFAKMLVSVCALIFVFGLAEGRSINSDMVQELADEVFDFKIRENPDLAATYGISKYQDKVQEWNVEAFNRRINESEKYLVRVRDYLAEDVEAVKDKLTLQIMEHSLSKFLEGSKFMHYTRSLNVDLSGLKNVLTVTNKVDTLEKLNYWYKKVQAYQTVFADQKELLQEGIDSKLTPAMPTCENVLSNYKKALGDTFDDFFAFQPWKDLNISDTDKEFYDQGEQECMKLRVAMSDFVNALENDYLPECRDDAHTSASSLPGGDKYYEAALKYYTADYVTPEYAHKLGLKEVERITTDMKQIIKDEGFDLGIGDYVEHLLSQPGETFSSQEEVKVGFLAMLNDRIRPNISLEFNKEPNIDLQVLDAPYGGIGRYEAPQNIDGKWTDGLFVYDGSKPETLLKIVMLPTMVHEGTPGHHYQYSYMLTKTKIPDFRRYVDGSHKAQSPFNFPSYTVYVEGWALYAEYLSEQMGIVQTEKERFGKLSMESLRAARLVVDTGLHYYNWTMQKAADYLKETTALSNDSCWTQVERYIRWPGQSCSYKIGELKIREIRKKAEKEFGKDFSPQQFHNALLKFGPCPMEILEKEMYEWIDLVKDEVPSAATTVVWSGVVSLAMLTLLYC